MIYRTRIYCFWLLLLAICFAQCAKKYEYTITDNSIVIDSISPKRGTENTQVRIYGKNFPADTSKIKAFFNNKMGLVVEKSTNNVILASVPYEAGTGKVTLKISDKTIDGPLFTYDYDAPVILSILPLVGNAGTEITINGRKFSSILANNKVMVNGVIATITASTITQLKALIPETKNGAITVTSNGITNQGPVFKFVPQIISLDKTSAYMGDILKITGKYLDAGPNLVVNFNGVNAQIISSTSTTVDVKVPASTSGNILLSVDGVNSNVLPFNYKIAPNISGLSKSSAFAQDSLTIYGTNFNNGSAPIVLFNNIAANVVSYSATQIKVYVPNGTNGNVTVSVDGVNSNTFPFTYLQNITATSLTQISPVLLSANGIDGTSVVLKGNNFGTDINNLKVTIGTQTAQLVSANDGSVTFLAPSYASSQNNTQQIKIYRNNVEASYPNGNLSYTYLSPTILSTTCIITPNGNNSSLYFTINGNNYNSTAPNANFEIYIDDTKYTPVVNGNTATITITQLTSSIKNRYDIKVKNKWGTFVSAFQRNLIINSFSYKYVNSKKIITINGDGFGSTEDINRSVRIYRIISGVKNYLVSTTITSWNDDIINVEFTDNFIDDLTYGIEVRVNTKLSTKEQFIDYNQVN